MKNKISGLAKIASSALLSANLLFPANSVQAHNPYPVYNGNYRNSQGFQNSNPPYFSNYHKQDDLANQPRTYNGTSQDFPILFPIITAAMLAALCLLAIGSRTERK